MRERIPFCDLSRALVPIRAEIANAVDRVVDSGWFLRGPEVAAFQKRMGSLNAAKSTAWHAIAERMPLRLLPRR